MIVFNPTKHDKILDNLVISNTSSSISARHAKQIVKNIWDIFAPEGIQKTILGYEFKIDTGISASVYCGLSSYGPNESKIIKTHVEVLLSKLMDIRMAYWILWSPNRIGTQAPPRRN